MSVSVASSWLARLGGHARNAFLTDSGYETLQELLEQREEGDRLVTSSSRISVAVFCDSSIAYLNFRTIAGLPVTERDVEERVATAVEIFLTGITRE